MEFIFNSPNLLAERLLPMRISTQSRRLLGQIKQKTRSARARRWLRLVQLEARTAPAIFTVNDPGDNALGTGDTGDLRYCVNAANSNVEDDTINIEFASPTTITLNPGFGEMPISEANKMTITVPS